MQAPSANPTPLTQVVDKGDSPHALAIRVDPLGNDDDLKAKVVPLCHHPLHSLMHDLAPRLRFCPTSIIRPLCPFPHRPNFCTI